jgi:LysM repeat protein
MTTIKSYKGFNKDLTCRGFQYEVGKEYECDKVVICEEGFHACENPIDCFSYYSPAESVFHEVEQSGQIAKHDDDSKVASTKIKIGSSINIKGIIKATFNFVKSKCTNSETGKDRSALNGGDMSALNGGYMSALNGGDNSKLTGGNYSVVYGLKDAQVRGGIGSVLAIAEFDDDYNLIKFHVKPVDGKKIKADTFYTLKNGKFVEVK